MKKVTLVVSTYLQNNNIFNEESKDNRDNIFAPFIRLKECFNRLGYDLNTQDIIPIQIADIVIYYNIPLVLPSKDKIEKSYLILTESELIRSDNYEKEKHQYFYKIFTWHDQLVDNQKYFKLNFSHQFPKTINKGLRQKEKLCTLIAGNKRVNHTLELYSQRVKTIRWFEKNNLDSFDLYGVNWDKYLFHSSKFLRLFNKIPHVPEFLARLTYQTYPSYKGIVENKKETMRKYKFSICYENAKDIPGYITEKIFDSFFAGCVPVYWGANNICDYVPSECFIDKRNFETHEQLYDFMKNMDDEVYLKYVDNIEAYLQSDKKYIFTDKAFSKIIVDEIVGEKR